MLFNKIGSLLAPALLCAALLLPGPARAVDLSLDGNLRGLCDTASASGGAATLANKCGVITSEALTTLEGSAYTLTLTNTVAAAADIVVASVANGTNTAGTPILVRATPAAGSIVFVIKNQIGGVNGNAAGAGATLNGTIKVSYFVIKP